MRLIILISFLLGSAAQAQWDNQIVNPVTGASVSLTGVTSLVHEGQVVVVSENHDSSDQHAHQVTFLKNLESDLNVSVGMEFFEYIYQSQVDDYLAKILPEADFLKTIGWGSISFDLYRQQVQFPGNHGGKAYALNLPRAIAHRIAQVGVAGLTAQERSYLPADFQIGNALYRQRFVDYLNESHSNVPPEMIQPFFEAQSAWDDTMALKASEALAQNPRQVIFVLVGNVHAEYGGGLPDRMKARGIKDLLVIPQVDASNLTNAELLRKIGPDPSYGPMGDFVWINGDPKAL